MKIDSYIPASFILSICLALGGCTSDKMQDSRLIVSERDAEIVMTAQIDGTLTITSGLCFGIETAEGTYTAVFPAGTTAMEDALTIPRLGTIHVGEELVSGGGFVLLADTDVTIPDPCQTNEIILLTPS